jgi:phosphoribosylcarboxyaminoimidazole (NCAIR) mutase
MQWTYRLGGLAALVAGATAAHAQPPQLPSVAPPPVIEAPVAGPDLSSSATQPTVRSPYEANSLPAEIAEDARPTTPLAPHLGPTPWRTSGS